MRNMKRAAGYARYSSEMQHETSIEGQFLKIDGLAKKESLELKLKWKDSAITGDAFYERDGLLKMLEAAKAGKFDVLIVESLSRLSRRESDLHYIWEKLEYHGIPILTDTGWVTSMEVAFRGIMNADFRKRLGSDVKRGHNVLITNGKLPGNLPYGYHTLPGRKGEAEIVEAEAKLIRRIFQMYLQGYSPRDIAVKLNSEKIASPGGKLWNASVISGGGQLRLGILTNPLYAGVFTWGKTRYSRDPETKRKRKLVSKEAAKSLPCPQLRIVDQDLWDAVREKREARALANFGPGGKRPVGFVARGKHLLAGMLRCGLCGGNMRMTGITKAGPWAGCAAANAHNACSHKRGYNLDRLQLGVVRGMKERLTDPEALAEMAKAHHATWAERSKQNRSEASSLDKEVTRLQAKIDRLNHAIRDGDEDVSELLAMLKPLKIEHTAKKERLRIVKAETNIVDLHPSVIDVYKRNIERLHKALSGEGPFALEDRFAFQNLMDHIVVHPTGRGEVYKFSPYGRLGALMGIELYPSATSDSINSGAPRHSTGEKVIALGRWAA